MKKPRVLFLSHSSGLAGAERCLLETVLGLNDVERAVGVPGLGRMTDVLKREHIPFREIWTRKWIPLAGPMAPMGPRRFRESLPGRVRALRRWMREGRFDLVYSYTCTVCDGALAARVSGIPHIWHVQEIFNNRNDLSPCFNRGLVSAVMRAFSDVVVFCSQASARSFGFERTSRRTRVIYNGVDTGRFRPDGDLRREWRRRLGIGPNGLAVGTLGGCLVNKGIWDFLEAAARVVRQRPDARFVVGGYCPPEAVGLVRDRIRRDGMERHVRLCGYVDQPEGVYNALDIVVSASHYEAFSRVILEAMACGKPVVATDSGGPRELVVHAETGVLVPPRDAKALAAGLLDLARYPEQREAMGKAGLARAQEMFSLSTYVRKTRGVIMEVLDTRGRFPRSRTSHE